MKNGECSPMQFCMEIPKLCSKSAKRFWGTRKSVPKIDTGFALSDLRRCQQPLPIGGVAQWQASQLSRYDVRGSIPPAVMLLLPILPFCFASSRLLSFCFGYENENENDLQKLREYERDSKLKQHWIARASPPSATRKTTSGGPTASSRPRPSLAESGT